ncbi:acetylxylan esterase [Streptomyces sp. VRA16 Mangrove soil]|uniref:acetylxylan esterase n=1 Tax=Streptomyces sp. VRA16 Mangrove soil TaxID=2817434 RepID=UPI001A9D3300|nr:acetylxylan esterase [Streptomyces sp. VRA16 Mangrove soil]MBO1336992.1 acetylxylan esterase [Streptomyces sp. VRA16 Mangrove soil]
MTAFAHDFPFDPTYGYTLDDLLAVPGPGDAPDDFDAFWRGRYERARAVETRPEIGRLVEERDGVRIFEVTYASVGGVRLGGWLVLPAEGAGAEAGAGAVEHGFVIGHGYGGRDAAGPDVPLPLPRSAAILPCVRGMVERGLVDGVPSVSAEHVLHGIAARETYVIGECVADLWCAASALLELVPELGESVAGGQGLGYLGESFGGGLGALALPWDDRFAAGELTVPTFGNHPLRLTLDCIGSGASVRRYRETHPEVVDVLRYFDAATAAERIGVPVLVAAALFDPSVPPPGQFAVFNSLGGDAELMVLEAGHFEFAGLEAMRGELASAKGEFFGRVLK